MVAALPLADTEGKTERMVEVVETGAGPLMQVKGLTSPFMALMASEACSGLVKVMKPKPRDR